MLPLLREQEGAGGQSRTSTAEERVIGAGLKALEKHEDGEAVKELFHMFAVTQVSERSAPQVCSHSCHAYDDVPQEDFVHPIAVIELLWRSCCASEAE